MLWSRKVISFPMISLADRVIVVTGASRGIGAGLVRAYGRAGLRVAGCARRQLSAEQISALGPGFFYRALDMRQPEAVKRFAQQVWDRFGGIDLWINNAGVLDPIGMGRNISAAAFADHLAINVNGVFNGCRAYLNLLHERARQGAIVNIGSGAAQTAYRGWAAYCAGKAAVDQLTRVLSLEEAEHGNRVSALAPGIIETDMQVLIRAQGGDAFPDVEKFRGLHREGALAEPSAPGKAILLLAFGPAFDPRRPIFDLRDSAELQDLSAIEI